MSNERERTLAPGQPVTYRIRLKGHLGPRWADRFGGMTITLRRDGDTQLTGPVIDQAALHGLLKTARDLGLPLVSINPMETKEEGKMNTISRIANKTDTSTSLSTLWIIVLISMLKADILSLFIPGALDEVARTAASAGVTIPQLMLVAAFMGELAVAMIILSRVLRHGLNRVVNIVVALITIAYIWGGAASFPHYIFIALVETICLLLVIWIAWTWRGVEA
jgi:hypothetical protein